MTYTDPLALPDGWVAVSLGSLLDGIEAGKSFECLTRPAASDEWGIIKVSAMTWGTFDERENKAVPPGIRFDPSHEIGAGDLLLSRANTTELVGATVLVAHCRHHLLLSDKSMRLLVPPQVDSRWLKFALTSPSAREQMSAVATGTSDSMRNISQDKVRAISLLLPPLPEQRRIVAEIETQFARLEAGVAALKRVQANLKRYRAAVLHAACEGRLVPTEAELARAEGRDYETGDQLLARAVTERVARMSLGRAALTSEAPRTATHPIQARPNSEGSAAASSGLPQLSPGWAWARVDQVGSVQLGRQRAPQHHIGSHMRPYLRVANVYEDRLDLSNVLEMNFDPIEFETYRLRSGDILLNEG
jgi:type I restriction enzyme S subunit